MREVEIEITQVPDKIELVLQSVSPKNTELLHSHHGQENNMQCWLGSGMTTAEE